MKLRLLSRSRSIREAAATIFAVSSLLPLLVFLYLLWRYELVAETDAQLGLLLALLIALLGFVVFQRMVNRISDLAQAVITPKPADLATTPAEAAMVPGLGPVAELGQITDAFNRLLEDLRGSTERLEDLVFKLGTLNEMVELAARIPAMQDLLGLVLERTMRTVRARIGSIMLLDRERQTLRIAAARGLPEEVTRGVEVRVGEGIAGRAVQLGEPILVDDVETDPRFGKANDPKYGGGSFICMPVRVGDRIIGVINLAKKEYGATTPADLRSFGPSDLQFLNALMTYIAYALDNARLLEEARQAASRLAEVVRDQQLRLTLAQQQMLQTEKLSALGQLVAGVAHELNNPLTVLLGSAHIMRDQAPEPLHPTLDLMVEQAERSRRIVQGLLTFARRLPLERERVDLGDLLAKVLSVTASDLQLAGISVEQQVEPGLPPLWADGGQLQQVLLNLVTNAKQAMTEADGDRRLRIAMRRAGPDRVVILVQDTGPGVPAEILPKVFDPFVTTKGARGTGLGLSISYGIIQEHGGDLRVDSTGSQGTTFAIELPIGTLATEPVKETPGGPATLAGRRILVVEDDPAVRRLVHAYLEAAGCDTVCVTTAEEALEALSEPVDLVLSDVYLPGMDALALYREATTRDSRLRRRFLLMTGGLITDAIQGFLAQGEGKLLQKPFSREQLLDVVRELLK
ncbi:MAG: GAF domain-containing protein [Candidatus Rokubacteria bacterium]|nr:GAF domain-containing protein [Candidatus Rokubacteria bacterium]